MRKFFVFAVVAVFALGFVAVPTYAKDAKKKATPEESFKKLDKDNDSKLSKSELTGKAKDAAKAEKRFNHLDKNKDGSVSLEEFKAAGEKKAKKEKK